MRLIKQYQIFLENISLDKTNESDEKEISYNVKNLVSELCVCMILINNEFLDNILDRGLKARYQENTQVFLTDLKNLVLGKNRLQLGVLNGDKFVKDNEISKVNKLFDDVEFDIEKNWDTLVNARITARNIIDKTLVDEKLTEDLISNIYWVGPNKSKKQAEDFIIEMNDGRQIGFYLSKSLNSSSNTSFNKVCETLVGGKMEGLYDINTMKKWDRLIQEWVKIIYKNGNKNVKVYIEKFIDPLRIDSLTFYNYYEVQHRDPKYKVLGEHIKEFDKNIIRLHDLLENIWKNKESMILEYQKVEKEWLDTKQAILNSKILEHTLTNALIKSYRSDIEKKEDGWKKAGGKLKMRFIKLIVDKIGSTERDVFGLSKNGNVFHSIPSRDFFRGYYEDMEILFDYHVKMLDDIENPDFNIKIKLLLDNKELLTTNVTVKPTGQMGDNLTAKIKFTPIDSFNLAVSDKKLNRPKEEDNED